MVQPIHGISDLIVQNRPLGFLPYQIGTIEFPINSFRIKSEQLNFLSTALMPVPAIEHEILKSNYEKALQQHFIEQPDFWKTLEVDTLEFVSNEGTQNIPGPGNRPAPGKGGLCVWLVNSGEKRGFLWMRGSGTEPVFRVMVDWNGAEDDYNKLLELHRKLIAHAN